MSCVCFFPEKYYWSFIYMKWFISTFFVPLPGNSENAKKLKVPHANAESSLDVLGVRPQVHECDCHRRSCSSTTADPKQSGLHAPVYHHHQGKMESLWQRGSREGTGERDRERERNLQDSSRFQEAVPSITCVTPDDIRSQILDFTASHQGKFLPVQSLHKLPFGLFGTPCPAGIL